MNTLIALILIAAPPSFAGTFGDPDPVPLPVVAQRPPMGIDGLSKKVETLAESVNHIGDRVSSVERVAKYAARKVAQTIDASPTSEETGLDGWQGTRTSASLPAPPVLPAQSGMVWCAQCGAYVPAGYFVAPQTYQTPARGYGASYGAYRPVQRQAPAFARGGG